MPRRETTEPRGATGTQGSREELLDAGQEEVFSRTEVESGHIEHHSGREPREEPDVAAAEEAQTERQAPDNAGPGSPAS